MIKRIIRFFNGDSQLVSFLPIGATVAKFETSGCQAQVHKFVWFGTIRGEVIIQNTEFFKVEIIKDADGYDILNELDNVKLYKNVPKNYLHKINKGLYIIYD